MKWLKLIFLLFFAQSSFGQQDTTFRLSDVLEVSGYIKDLQILTFGNNLDDINNDNLIHNRVNLRYFPSDNFTAALEIRNRIFTGETVDALPNYAHILSTDNGLVDLSWAIINAPSMAFISQIDRAWVEWTSDNWEVRAGRQRINWGYNLFWNSNDIFNAYSFVDFDYEERAGSDALRVQRHFNNLSTLELAIKPGKDKNDWIGAIRYGFNIGTYDIQVLAGQLERDYVIGTGWAGNIGDAGFKGEITYFHPSGRAFDKKKVVSTSVSIDYIFSNQLFLTGGFLINSGGVNSPLEEPQNLFLAPVTAKNLMPSKYNTILSISFPLTPLAGFSFNTVYSPGVQSLLLMPSINWSIANNWEIALFAQNFNLKVEDFENIGNGVFIRIKGSY